MEVSGYFHAPAVLTPRKCTFRIRLGGPQPVRTLGKKSHASTGS
jgi:hypothetical protein